MGHSQDVSDSTPGPRELCLGRFAEGRSRPGCRWSGSRSSPSDVCPNTASFARHLHRPTTREFDPANVTCDRVENAVLRILLPVRDVLVRWSLPHHSSPYITRVVVELNAAEETWSSTARRPALVGCQCLHAEATEVLS